MAFMEWEEELSVGEHNLDIQHQKLITLINDVYEQVQQCESLEEERSLTGRFLTELREYSQTHFVAEEAILAKHHYNQLADHKQEHGSFIEELHRLENSYSSGQPALSFDVFSFARNWYIDHIMVSDRKYMEALKK